MYSKAGEASYFYYAMNKGALNKQFKKLTNQKMLRNFWPIKWIIVKVSVASLIIEQYRTLSVYLLDYGHCGEN